MASHRAAGAGDGRHSRTLAVRVSASSIAAPVAAEVMKGEGRQEPPLRAVLTPLGSRCRLPGCASGRVRSRTRPDPARASGKPAARLLSPVRGAAAAALASGRRRAGRASNRWSRRRGSARGASPPSPAEAPAEGGSHIGRCRLRRPAARRGEGSGRAAALASQYVDHLARQGDGQARRLRETKISVQEIARCPQSARSLSPVFSTNPNCRPARLRR